MKKKEFKMYCIKKYEERDYSVLFNKGEIYNANTDERHIEIFDYNNRRLIFHINSPFSENTVPLYFVKLKELRRQKIDKLNKL